MSEEHIIEIENKELKPCQGFPLFVLVSSYIDQLDEEETEGGVIHLAEQSVGGLILEAVLFGFAYDSLKSMEGVRNLSHAQVVQNPEWVRKVLEEMDHFSSQLAGRIKVGSTVHEVISAVISMGETLFRDGKEEVASREDLETLLMNASQLAFLSGLAFRERGVIKFTWEEGVVGEEESQ